MFALLSGLFRSSKASPCEPRPRPPRFRPKRDAATPSALLNVLGWQPPVPIQRDALTSRRSRIA
jgi:hypothetical protein